ncbi:MAG: hypothetical protein IPG96_13780 [Proteobacteria bacterium]|nr:hypothetical protein [Pseudomonadota bacterium]
MSTTTRRCGGIFGPVFGAACALLLVACGGADGGSDFGAPWEKGQGAPTTPAPGDGTGTGSGGGQALNPGGTAPGTQTPTGTNPQDPFGGYTPTNGYTGSSNPYGTQTPPAGNNTGLYGNGTGTTGVQDDGSEYALRLSSVQSGFEAALACNLWDARNLAIPATWALRIVPIMGWLWGSMNKLAIVRRTMYLRYGIALTDWGCDPRVRVSVGGKAATSDAFSGDAPNLMLLRGLQRGDLVGKTIDVEVLDHDSIIITEWDTTIARCTGTITEAAVAANTLTLSCSFPWPMGLSSVMSSTTITDLMSQTGATPAADGSIVQVTFGFRP